MSPPARRPRAFILADVVMGLVIVGLLAASVSVVLGRQARASQRMADEREATWAAERALARLQTGRDPAVADEVDGAAVAIEPAAGAAPPAGHAWVRVRAEVNGRSASLVGLVPDTAVPPPEGGSQ